MHQPKNIGYLGVWKHVHVSTSTHHITLLDPPQTVCNDFILFTLIMFPLGLAAITIFYFLSGYWLWKLTNISYYCDYVTITQYCCIMIGQQKNNRILYHPAAAAKSLQSCPTLCDHIDCSPPGSRVPGILQERTLEWVAISFSNAWKWKVKGKLLSRVWLFVTPWTAAYQAPLSMGFSRQEYWSRVPLPSPKFL